MTSSTTVALFDPRTYVSRLLRERAVNLPISTPTKLRNTALDVLFYDVGALTKAEFAFLVEETNFEGAILVVSPRGAQGEVSVEKYEDYATLRAAPGDLLTRFSIAGVGSSDVGAAAFARNLADHCGEPVGAIVAGYGVADVLAEGMGGWFVLGLGNRLLKLFHDTEAETGRVLDEFEGTVKGLSPTTASEVAATVSGSLDAATLLRLLLDEDRHIKTLLGHSKGCLSIAYALEALALTREDRAIERAKDADIITLGAVVELPHGFQHAHQFLGTLDWFGGMNSRWSADCVRIPNAWHHLNTAIPLHMSVRDVLRQVENA